MSTLTGRVRNRVSYSQFRNSPFQALCAGGAKLALFRLERAGYRTVAFIHDEVLIELPVETDHAEAARIETILVDATSEVFGHTVPVACEFALMRRWYKAAEPVYGENGMLIPWEPSRTGQPE